MIHPLDQCVGFEWDAGNSEKNWLAHKIQKHECEDVFFNPRLIYDDIKHSKKESRYHVLGQTNLLRKIFLTVTVRKNKIRVISARDMNRKERSIYEQVIKNHPKI